MNKIEQVNLNIFYGYKCNYSCDGCSSGSDSVTNTSLDPDLNEILDSIPVLSERFSVTSMLTLIGGEPFLYWDDRILPISLKLNEYFPGTRINIFTNGQLVGKNIDKILSLAEQIDELSITISRHTDSILDSAPGKIWKNSIDQLAAHEKIVVLTDDHYHVKDNIHANIYFYRTEKWKSYYYRLPDGKIKPHATNDPAKSMYQGCVGSVCACTFGSKFYKCPVLAPLGGHLKAVGQFDDPDWKKYISYQPLDLNNINEDWLKLYVDSYGKPISECDMCLGDSKKQIDWKDRSYAMIFRRQKQT